ncbi:hypothetical protein C7974DRAFT_195202 [Boeremia exigua]|uniref:uncharacterized protein n=1 Tax=Boeremia exigua TaxID=749465 RepID=UPI001E8EF0B6|nr:uncharacterized protein C7974DRAFT_195202 [Boeremia exigua]KAH6625129.1 hypothetical protein C7974DRAFT_195202 [Boeremia exigua]
MLWRKNQRSPSPPRLTSSTPAMERHLTTMDSGIEDPVKEADISSVAPTDGPVASGHVQESQAACSDNKPTPNPIQSPVAPAKDDANASTAPNKKNADVPPEKVGSIRSKARRSRPQFLTLVACVSYLLLQFLGVDLGLRFIHGYTEPRLNQAETQLRSALGGLAMENYLYERLYALHSIAMARQYQESYEHCVARGLFKADQIFLGIDYTVYPDVRDKTMEWVTDNCGRLLYTPQVYAPNPSRFWSVMANVRSSAEKTLALAKRRIALLRRKIRGSKPRPATDDPILELFEWLHDTTKLFEVPLLPAGFRLDCIADGLCRLNHTGPHKSATGLTLVEAAVKANKEVSKWTYPWKKVFRINSRIINVLTILQHLLSICYLLAVRLSLPFPLPRRTPTPKTSKAAHIWSRLRTTIAALNPDEKIAAGGLIVNTALYALLHYEFTFLAAELSRLQLPIGLGLCALHVPQALVFLKPSSDARDETLYSACRAALILVRIARSDDTLSEPSSVASAPAPAPVVHHPASRIGARFISPLTPIAEDLWRERMALRDERDMFQDDELYGCATESDSEYESDVQHASYVDLAGGVTPTVSEEEEWAVVAE